MAAASDEGSGCLTCLYHNIKTEVNVNVNVNVYIYSPDIPRRVQRTSQLHPLILELTLVRSHLPGENAALRHTKAAAIYQAHSQFSFHQVPITAGWTEAAWNEKFARRFYT